MSNYMYPDMHGSGIYDEHYQRCATNCPYATSQDPAHWEKDDSSDEWFCIDGHHADHECNCDEIAEERAAQDAEALVDLWEWHEGIG